MGNTVTEIDRIKEMLNKLSESALAEVGDFEGGGTLPIFS